MSKASKILEMTDNSLTDAEKAEIMKDFKEWSGGFEPQECEFSQRNTYLKATLPMPLQPKKGLVKKWFSELDKEDEKK